MGLEVEPLPEDYNAIVANDAQRESQVGTGKTWKTWLGDGNFYIHGLVYMLVRISINVS